MKSICWGSRNTPASPRGTPVTVDRGPFVLRCRPGDRHKKWVSPAPGHASAHACGGLRAGPIQTNQSTQRQRTGRGRTSIGPSPQLMNMRYHRLLRRFGLALVAQGAGIAGGARRRRISETAQDDPPFTRALGGSGRCVVPSSRPRQGPARLSGEGPGGTGSEGPRAAGGLRRPGEAGPRRHAPGRGRCRGGPRVGVCPSGGEGQRDTGPSGGRRASSP